MHEILRFAEGSPQVEQLGRVLDKKGSTVLLNEMVGGAFLFYMAATIARKGGVHIIVSEDRDAAAYALNDLYAIALSDMQRLRSQAFQVGNALRQRFGIGRNN